MKFQIPTANSRVNPTYLQFVRSTVFQFIEACRQRFDLSHWTCTQNYQVLTVTDNSHLVESDSQKQTQSVRIEAHLQVNKYVNSSQQNAFKHTQVGTAGVYHTGSNCMRFRILQKKEA